MNFIWFSLFMSGIIVAALTGRIHMVTEGVLTGAKDGVFISLGLISVIAFWLGMMKIAEESGLIQILSKRLRPFATWLYPSVPSDHPAMGALIANMSANILGLGNAATPLGLKAMQELQTLNGTSDVASDAMCTLLAMNTASLTLIPATMIGLRMEFHSKNPGEIIGSTILATLIATGAAIILDRFFRRTEQIRCRRRNRS
ncbi:Spore maturation protein A [Acidibacillus sp. S0AB]|uniref:Spore maturation protein A n=2 Tax=Sulfoacidibacillus ferrooxidans TaxID=2005001 RepID=A0A9X1V969_9BACL|nr:Spore maturation protein A [Sulfoacidibacillus ferrooxidans]